MALWATRYSCTMLILFRKLEVFPGKMPWGLPATWAITKPGLWRCGLGLDSSLVSAAQAMSGGMGKGSAKGSCAPSQEASLTGRALAEHLHWPRLLVQRKKVLKADGVTQESRSGLFSTLIWLKTTTSLAWWATAEITWTRWHDLFSTSAMNFQSCSSNILLHI